MSQFAIVMVIMLILGILQVVLVAVAQQDCGKKNNAFDFVCDIGGGSKSDLLWFWLPTCALLLTNVSVEFISANRLAVVLLFRFGCQKACKTRRRFVISFLELTRLGGTANNYY